MIDEPPVSATGAALATAHDHLVQALDALPDGLATFDPDDRLLTINAAYRDILHVIADLVQPGVRYETLLRAFLDKGGYAPATDDLEAWIRNRLAAREAGALTPEEFRIHDGRWIRSVDRRGADGAHVNVRIDVTQRRADQQRLREALERAEAASRAKSLFLATMSHEIRTPLNGMLGASALLRKHVTTPEGRAMVDALNESGEALRTIVNDVLDVSKIEAGKLVLEQAPFAPEAIRRKLRATHAIAAGDKGLDFAVDFTGDPALPRLGDLHRIMQIVNNLVSNAVKFTSAGGVRVHIDLTDAARLSFTVADDGCGMTEAQAARVFDDFVQADSSTTRLHGGTGLGMGIVRRLTEAMDGGVTVRSAPGAGTTVEGVIAAPLAQDAAAAEPGVEAAALDGMRVLAVDDNAINRMVMEAFLRDLGCAPTLAASGPEALSAAQDAPFDAILMDISMPGMDGIETLDALRRRDPALTTPVVAVTANVLPDQVEAYLAAGFAAHLGKPVGAEALAATLQRLA